MTPDDLLAHDDSGQPWPAAAPAFADAAAAYRVALAARALRLARGERPVGFKIGFTNRAIWSRYQVFAPIWGTVWNTTVSYCEGDGLLRIGRTCQPRIEPECVIGLRAAPAADTDLRGLFEAIDWVAPGFEIVQSHRPDWKFAAPDTMADNGLHARLLVGARRPVRDLAGDAITLQALLAAATVTLHRADGPADADRAVAPVDSGRGANVLDDPLQALLHFVRELRACPGAPDLRAGDLITTGTWTDAWPVQAGERWQARFSTPLSALSVRFA